jgi:hypothetical protein
MKHHPRPKPGKRRFHHYPRRGYVMHASAGIAEAAADFYFKLARGTATQREAAEEWRAIFPNREGLTP